LLQLWNDDGTLVWNKKVTSSAGDQVTFSAVEATSDAIYVCGQMFLVSVSKTVGLLMRFDLSGSKVWKATLIGPGGAWFDDLKVQTDAGGSHLSVQCCGTYYVSGDPEILYAQYTVDGDLSSATTWGYPGVADYGQSILLTGPDQSATYIAGRGSTTISNGYLLHIGGISLVITSPGGGIEGIDLEGTPRSALTLVSSAAGSVTLDDFDADLAFVGGEKISLAPSYLIPYAASKYGGSGLFITGIASGNGPPAVSATDDNLQESSVQWLSASPVSGNPSMVFEDLPLDPYDHANFVLNNADSTFGDPFFYVEAHE
jgi:hypothetical protein